MSVVDAVSQSHPRALLSLLVVCLLGWLPGLFSLPPIDRDEPRFAQATRQMVESGNYVDIRFQDEARYKKPIGIYWLQAGAVRVAQFIGIERAPQTIGFYRLPSLFGAIGAVWLTYWAALALTSRRAALLAGLLMAGCTLLQIEARLATTDALLLLTTTAAMAALAHIYLKQSGAGRAQQHVVWPATLWTAMAVGILVKGPVIVMVVALCAATLTIRDRSFAWLRCARPIAGLAWCALLTLPWLITIQRYSQGTFMQALADDIVPKMLHGVEGHGLPPGYYFVLFWVTFWPGSALTGLAVGHVMSSRRTAATAFLLAWLVPAWVVFELMPTKLPHYVLPLYPSVAILIAQAVDRGALSVKPALTRGVLWWCVLPAIVGVVAMVFLAQAAQPLVGMPSLLFVAAVGVAFVAWRWLRAGRAPSAVLGAVAASCLMSTAVYGGVAPRLRTLVPSAMVADATASTRCAQPLVMTSPVYQEPSMIFAGGSATRVGDAEQAVMFLGEGPCRFALVAATDDETFVQLATNSHVNYSRVTAIDGVNISNGERVAMQLYWSGYSPSSVSAERSR